MDTLEKQFSILQSENQILKEKNLQLSQLIQTLNRRHMDFQKRLALHSITGLPTHYQMECDLGLFLRNQEKYQDAQWLVFLIQLDSTYDMVKQTMKASVSEWVLYQLSQRLKDTLNLDDLIYHTRENEFILLKKIINSTQIQNYTKALSLAISEPQIFSGFNISLNFNMGISRYPEQGLDKTLLLHKADIALAKAKEIKVQAVVFEKSLEEQVIEKMELQNSIIKAIEAPAMNAIGHEFELYYQPKLQVEIIAPGKIHVKSIEAEVLIRWHHPQKGLLSPSVFIPIAEETGLIMPIGKWSLYQIVKQLNEWTQGPMSKIGLSFNLSARQFKDPELTEVVAHNVEQFDFPASHLTLEVTETCLFEDPFLAMQVITEFKKLGLKISVDDFGTGYSSLSHLHRFPLDEIKIDQSFIQNFPKNHRDKAIVRSVISIAKELGLKTVAEGVESIEQLRGLLDLECTIIQGFLFSKPLQIQDFVSFVENIQKQNNIIEL